MSCSIALELAAGKRVPARYDAISLDHWLLGEVGEVIDVIKRDGYTQVMADEAVRAHFIKEGPGQAHILVWQELSRDPAIYG